MNENYANYPSGTADTLSQLLLDKFSDLFFIVILME